VSRRILVTGHLGYVGAALVPHLRRCFPDAVLVGVDAGWFEGCLTATRAPEGLLDHDYRYDVRDLPGEVFDDVDAVVHLAAVSNDPIGNAFEAVTHAVNHRAAVAVARRARAAGARAFVLASSCSVYGRTAEDLTTEACEPAPLTAYATSKVQAEAELAGLAADDFAVTSLRFATACGMSDRLRLDLVLNDFVASAVATGEIRLLSDGSAWRPLIHVRDMARAIEWALGRPVEAGGPFLAVNAGCDGWNFRIRELAGVVAGLVPGAAVTVAPDAQPDRRSYRVGFGLFARLAPDHQPRVALETAVSELRDEIGERGLADVDFRRSRLIRLVVLDALRREGRLTSDLLWVPHEAAQPAAAGPR
jgi:nucleoside-diphosphate-sugar epimerase